MYSKPALVKIITLAALFPLNSETGFLFKILYLQISADDGSLTIVNVLVLPNVVMGGMLS